MLARFLPVTCDGNANAGLLAQVVHISNAHLLAPERYPRFTLVGQAQGSLRMAYAALTQLKPQVG